MIVKYYKFSKAIMSCAIVTFISFACLLSTATAQLPDEITEVEGISEYQLDNGVKLLLFPDDSKPQFTVNMTVLVGSRHEGYGESGMAHLLEHMLFRGTDLFPDIPKLLKDRGVLNMNGTTSIDRTNYFETLPASGDNLEFAISMEADRLVNSWIKQEHLDAEMTIVRSEFERGENSPQRILFQRIMDAAYQWHNYGKSTIGNRSDIMRVPASNLRVFYRKFYQPDNITLVVAGKFDKQKALELVEEKFGAIPRPKRELPSTYTEEPAQDGERNVVLRRSGDVQLVGVGYHVPSAASDEYAATEVLATLLSMQPSGPLYKTLVETKLATSVMAMDMVGHDPGMLIAMAEVPADADLEKAKEVLISEVESLSEKGVTKEEVDRAIRRILKQRDRQFANTERFATNLSEWESYGDWRLYFLHRDRLEKVTADDVQELAKEFLIQSNRTLGIFIPTEDAVRASIVGQPDLKSLVADYKGREKMSAGEAFEATPENIDKRTLVGTLDSGIKYALLEKENRGDEVILQAALHYGDENSLKGRHAAADILPQLMTRGTKQLSFQEFRDRLDELKATLGIGGGIGSLSINIQTKRENLDEVLDLLKQALREPSLNEKEFEVLRGKQKTQIESGMSEPTALAFVEFSRKLDPHPADDVRYSPTMKENLERVEKVTLDDVKSLYQDFIGGEHGEIAVVGDFDDEAILEKLNSVFADWKTDQPYARIEEPANPKAASGRFSIDTPDKANAAYIAGLSVPVRDDDADYEAMLVGNYIMGGGPLSSRIADRVRKKDGLSYTAMTRFQADSEDERGMYMMFCISNPTNTEKVVETVAEEVDRMLSSGVTGEELDKAKESYLNNRKGKRAKDRTLAGQLLSNLKTGRTMDFQANSDQKIESLSKDRVDQALKRLIQPDKMVIVTAGDFSKSESTQTSNQGDEAKKGEENK
jgi:zinc protease